MLAARTVSIAFIPQGVALTTGAIFEHHQRAGRHGRLLEPGGDLLALAVTRSFIIFGNVVLSVRVEFTFATLLRKNVFDHVLDQPGNRALPESTGEAVTRFREDVDYITRYLQRFGFAIPSSSSAPSPCTSWSRLVRSSPSPSSCPWPSSWSP